MTSRKSTQRTSAAAGDIPPTPVTDLEEDDSSSEDEEILDGICATDSLRYMARKQKGDGASTAATGAGAGNAPTATGTTRGGRNHRGGPTPMIAAIMLRVLPQREAEEVTTLAITMTTTWTA